MSTLPRLPSFEGGVNIRADLTIVSAAEFMPHPDGRDTSKRICPDTTNVTGSDLPRRH
jgi:hypothetical protein